MKRFTVFVGLIFAMIFGTLSACVPAPVEGASTHLAYEARARAPWTMPDDIFRNYVLPDTSVGEDWEFWRLPFREKFLPLVKDCRTTTEAAETLNREIWKILGVRYSPLRDKPDQSPFHSMRIGIASCTGLSIILIDACRSVGVPARFVGCRWKNKPGNHSWVEIWDNGEWKHLGAGDGGSANKTWFDADAAQADPNDPKYAIYAACADETGLTFPLAWRGGEASEIPAINVTERYLRMAEKLPAGTARVSLDLRSRDGVRVVREIVIFKKNSGEEIFRGKTHDNRFDLNDHLAFVCKTGEILRVALASAPEKTLAEIVVPEKDRTFVLRER